MNNPLDPTLRDLNDCGCCAGTSAQTPTTTDNRPGLPSIRFRAGVHSQFKATLLAALSSQEYPALRGLRTRENDDFTIALLDAFASTADVLTFYSERIANESYLRTATERRSVLELARAIGYELAPGVAAGVMLSFTVEGGTGAPGTAIIPKGTKAQSIPGPDEKPQTFETSLEFTGRAAWNELRPRLRAAAPEPHSIADALELYLAGTATNLKRGDVLVLSSDSEATAKRIVEIVVDRGKDHTYIKFQDDSTETSAPMASPPADIASATPRLKIGSQPTKGGVGDQFKGSVSSARIYELTHYFGWDISKIQRHLNSLPRLTPFSPDAGVFAMRARAGFFGHNAPKWLTLPDEMRGTGNAYPKDWDNLDANANAPFRSSKIWQDSQGNQLNQSRSYFDMLLERPVPEVVAGSWLVLETESSTLFPLRVSRNSELSRADFAMSAKCARLTFHWQELTSFEMDDNTTRGTTAHLQSEPLDVIGAPITEDLKQDLTTLELDRIDLNLFEGQFLALMGENADLSGTTQREIIVVAAINHTDVTTTLTLKGGLQHNYRRETVTLNANVVPATHGETTQEVLGSGDAARPFQSFTLKQKPLTYAFPPDAGQPESSLEVWVDDVKWREAATFYESGPRDRVYIVRLADDGTTMVQFGDGRRGSRLPSGRENVRAVYRKGIGRDGLVNEEQISLLLTQPLGVKAVSNLLKPQGAEGPQSLDEARVNAPRTVLMLDRVVSLQDYEDFARDFPGVAKAHAAWTWVGQSRGILLTLLGPKGSTITDGEQDQPAAPLRKALAQQGSARVPIRIASQPPSLFAITGTVRVDADRLPTRIEAEVKAVLRARFSFGAREFGQGVALSEVIAVIQNVSGVAFLDVTSFEKTSPGVEGSVTPRAVPSYQLARGNALLPAEPAELLMLNESSLPRLEVKSL